MKISIDKKFTENYMMARTKEHMKEFKEAYTDGDLLRTFREALNDELGETNCYFIDGLFDEIKRCELRAFPGGTQEEDTTHYAVDILTEGFRRFTKISFYITQTLNVRLKSWDVFSHDWLNLYSIECYTMTKSF